jgi:dCTP diphosphatase
MSDISSLQKQIIDFCLSRGWTNNGSKDIALSLVLESAEVLEHFQWKDGEKLEKYLKDNKEAVGDEIADVFIYLLQLCESLDIDLA